MLHNLEYSDNFTMYPTYFFRMTTYADPSTHEFQYFSDIWENKIVLNITVFHNTRLRRDMKNDY